MNDFDVLCVGAVNHDTIAVVNRLPDDDGRMIADELVVGHGGPAAQAAVTLARLGHSVALCTSVGDDIEGRSILAELEAEGVDVRYATIEPRTATAKSIVIVNTSAKSRSIVTSAYHSRPSKPPLNVSTIVHVDQVGFAPVLEGIRRGEPSGQLSVDGGNPIPGLDLAPVWLYAPTLSVLTSGTGEQSGSANDAAKATLAQGPEVVVATDGGRGSWWFDAEQSLHVPAVSMPIASSLGAGDVFHGALLSAIVDHRPPSDALRWANLCAAISCRSIDGRSGIPKRDEMDRAFTTATLERD